jgi:probable HAF family extracellular repeat protein
VAASIVTLNFDSVAAVNSAAVQTTYFITSVAPPGSDGRAAYAINESGQIVGFYNNVSNDGLHVHGFLYSDGTYTTIDPPGGTLTNADAINASGQIVGFFNDAGVRHGVLYSDGTYTTLDFPGSTYTSASAINDAGQIAGTYADASGHEYDFLYSGGTYTTIDPSNNLNTGEIVAINASGQMIGQVNVGGPDYQGYLYSSGSYTTIDPPGSSSTTPYAINDAGQIVGKYLDASNHVHGFFYSDGTYTTIDFPGSIYTSVSAINDADEIAGIYFDVNDQPHGFLYNGGTYTPIGFTGTPYAINDSGQVVGEGGFVVQWLSSQMVLTSANEGVTTAGPVSTFTDTDVTDTASSFAATVNWGDGTTEAGTITGSNGSFTVAVPGSTHFYADEGTDTATVTITRTADGTQAATTGTVNVTDAPLSAVGTTISGTEGIAISNTAVATFTDADPNATVSDFTAIISWGDGCTTTGAVVARNGGFAVDGGHTYASDGRYAGYITVNDVGGSTASANVAVTVDPAAPVITTGGTTSIIDPTVAGTIDPNDAVGSSVAITVTNSANVVVQQIQSVEVNAQGGFSSRLELPTDGQYSVVATLTTSAGLSASSNAAAYSLNSTANAPYFATNDAAEVARLYYGLLDRAPDAGGLAGFTAALDNGASPQMVAQSILGSAEYETTSIGQSNASFVQYLYSTALGRASDAAGLQGWETALNTGALSRANVVNGFLSSSEFQSDYAGQSNATYINEVYEVALQRPAESGGLAGWETAVSNGMSRTTFDQMVVGSAEFQSSIAQPANVAFVGTLYEQALGRAPDPQGSAGWTGAINANLLNNASVAVGIAESPEAQQFLAPRIENGWHLA